VIESEDGEVRCDDFISEESITSVIQAKANTTAYLLYHSTFSSLERCVAYKFTRSINTVAEQGCVPEANITVTFRARRCTLDICRYSRIMSNKDDIILHISNNSCSSLLHAVLVLYTNTTTSACSATVATKTTIPA
jgi:hypothetical protein